MTLPPSLQALYHELILEHHAHPRGAGPLEGASHQARVDNPLCGDRVTLRLRVEPGEGAGGRVAAARFEADGCALSIASASLLTTRVIGLSPEQVMDLFHELRRLLGPSAAEAGRADRALLGELVAFEGARQFPARIR